MNKLTSKQRDAREEDTMRPKPAKIRTPEKAHMSAQRTLSVGVTSAARERPVRSPANLVAPKAPIGPTRLEATIATAGDLARRYPSVAAFVATASSVSPLAPQPTGEKTKKGHKAGVRQRLAELHALLAEGWEIVQPIFARPLWTAPDDTATAFNFVLSRAQATRLITVPEGATVARFIRSQQLAIDIR